MSEYDSSHVYVPLERLQEMRLLKDPQGRVAVNQVQIKVKPGVDIDRLAELLQTELDAMQPRRAHSTRPARRTARRREGRCVADRSP